MHALAQAKLDDANNLLLLGRSGNAYYLAGYSVELGLKACIATQIAAETIPDKDLLRGVLNHEFSKLIGLAGLRTELKDEQNRNPSFAANWAIVAEWSPDSRYETIDMMSAQTLIDAIGHPQSGVLKWIKTYW